MVRCMSMALRAMDWHQVDQAMQLAWDAREEAKADCDAAMKLPIAVSFSLFRLEEDGDETAG